MSAPREHMRYVKRGLHSEQVAVDFAIARHRLPVEIETQRLRNGGASLGQFLHVIGQAGVLAHVAVGLRLPRLAPIAASMVQQPRAYPLRRQIGLLRPLFYRRRFFIRQRERLVVRTAGLEPAYPEDGRF